MKGYPKSARELYKHYYHEIRLHDGLPPRSLTGIEKTAVFHKANESYLYSRLMPLGWRNVDSFLRFTDALKNHKHSIWGIPF